MHRLRKRHRRRGNTLHSLWISGGGAAVSLSCALPGLDGGDRRTVPQTVRIPRGVTVIETWALAWCLGLSRVYLPETIRTIQEKAFSGVNATIFYPRQCFSSPWVGKKYGGTLDWIPM